jgi:site-specific DNA recombinase
MFTPERLTELLSTIAARRQERTAAVDRRLASLKSQVVDAEDRLKRLYRGIEEGIVELDDLLRERIVEPKAREKAQAAYDHAASQVLPSASIDPERIAAFGKLMRGLLDNGETPARKASLRTLIGAIIVGDKSVKIVGSKEAVRAAILGKPGPLQNVRGLGPGWRTRHDSNV